MFYNPIIADKVQRKISPKKVKCPLPKLKSRNIKGKIQKQETSPCKMLKRIEEQRQELERMKLARDKSLERIVDEKSLYIAKNEQNWEELLKFAPGRRPIS